jgi:uncharacterized repeat protein (TIGR03803 family)
MNTLGFSCAALGTFAAIAMLSGCGGGSGMPLSPSPAFRMTSPERAHVPTSYSVLYSFKPDSKDGIFPSAGLDNINGTLYGTTKAGGGDGCLNSLGCGTVFSVTASGKETVLHRFNGGSADGATPLASLLSINGTLYGTTAGGGADSNGTVFSITTSGKETVLYSFKGGTIDGQNPQASLINANGTLYGTTGGGGADSNGTVFSITTSVKETVLYSFKGGTTDGAQPLAGLIDVKGTLYGTTNGGGTHCKKGHDCGTVFAITPSGEERLLYSFKGGMTDGQNPAEALINVKGKLYGTTLGGGTVYDYCYYDCGTVFSVTTGGAEKVLHSFGGGSISDGAAPQAALLDINGGLYGTTAYGGSYASAYPNGTVFEISTSGKERVLHSFGHGLDGAQPVASLIDVAGTLYGTTTLGGSGYCFTGEDFGCGTVFALKP